MDAYDTIAVQIHYTTYSGSGQGYSGREKSQQIFKFDPSPRKACVLTAALFVFVVKVEVRYWHAGLPWQRNIK